MAKTIIFDLGGVLVHLDWDGVCGRFVELSGRADEFVRREVMNGPIVTSSMMGQLGAHDFHQALCDKLGIDLGYEDFVSIWNGLLSANEAIVPLVEQLKSGHRLVLASNTDAIHLAHSADNFGVLRQFDHRFLSYEMGLLKPDPAFFHYVLRALDTPAADCIFIDDRADNVASARTIGIAALQFAGDGQLQTDLNTVL